jgi:hypothetical protein
MAELMVPTVITVESDVPEGMTLREWRRSRTPARKHPPLVRLVRRVCGTQGVTPGWLR